MRVVLVALMFAVIAFSGCTEDQPKAADDDPDQMDPPDTIDPGPGPADPGDEPRLFTVMIKDIAFKSGSITINVGDTVEWVHDDGAIIHRVETGEAPADFDSGDMSGGDVFNFTFTQAGEYNYFCRYHGSMVERITVVDPAAGGTNTTDPPTNQTGDPRDPVTWDISIEGVAFKNGSITIQKGDTVKWTHRDGTTPHTVTANNDGFDSGPVYMTEHVNAEFEHTFNDVGDFGYFCEVHPGMTGTITVLERYDGTP